MKMSFWGWFGIILGFAGGAIGIYAAIDPMAIGNFFMKSGPDNIAMGLGIGMPIIFIAIFGAAFGPFVMSAINNSKKKKNYAVEIRAAMGWTLDLTISTLRVG